LSVEDTTGAIVLSPAVSAATRTRKTFFAGTHRSCSPAETFERLRPCFPEIGLTRVADITGLDRVGVPVTIAIRPNSPTLVTCSGKGLSLEAARTSGAAEAIELFCAERIDAHEVLRASYRDLAERFAMIPDDRLQFSRKPLFRDDWPYEWLLAWDIATHAPVPVPRSSVEMVPDDGRVRDLCCFQATSNGLASGNNLPEAVTAGLLEVIERDAAACWALSVRAGRAVFPRVRLDTIDDPACLHLLEQMQRSGISVMLFDITVDTAVAVYMAYIGDDEFDRLSIFKGYGAHLDPAVAISRALTEALQGRLVFIAGSRDDMSERHFWQARQLGTRAAFQALRR